MGVFGFILLVIVILAILGLGWKTFTSAVITGFDQAVEAGTPIVKNLTQEAREYVDSSEQLTLFSVVSNQN
jgi:cell shape-determining protein MreC